MNAATHHALFHHRDDALDDLPHDARASLVAVRAVLAAALPKGTLSVYEAGGGTMSFLPPSLMARARTTVVDIDSVQLANNRYADEKILGDIQTVKFPGACFDLVTSYNVIEHLPDVEAALLNFFDALRPGGLVLIGAPIPGSLTGMVTRHSPHWFHVWFYRVIRGHQRAGEPGEPPFETHFHPLVAPPRLRAFAQAQGFEVLYERLYESPRFGEMRERLPRLARVVDTLCRVVNALLPAGSDVRRGDYHMVLRKV